jgi:S-adenosylmethionine:tRNA ribosyltransferase-isomerase
LDRLLAVVRRFTDSARSGFFGRALRFPAAMPTPDQDPRLRVADFDYVLPSEAIAQTPVEPRDAARLLVLVRRASSAASPALSHHHFGELAGLLRPGDLLVVNDSRVIPARLPATREGGGAAEVLMLRLIDDGSGRWEALVRPSRKVAIGAALKLRSGEVVEVGDWLGGGTRAVRFDRDPLAVMAEAGETPLPPYIHDHSTPAGRYQTVYADPPGSAAAPTAGLHFTPELMAKVRDGGVGIASVTLHVGLDTFRPLEGEFVDEHRIHREWYEVPPSTRAMLDETRRDGGRTIAVGTTSVRVLETAARTGVSTGWTDLYVTPPFAFAAVDALITNFHLPRSSLLLLVTAFVQARMAGASPLEARDTLLTAYRSALASGYRFFSFGDAMLIV